MPQERNRWIYDLIYCGECGCHVPVFRDLAPPEQRLLEQWKARPPRYLELAQETGLTPDAAKTWICHLNKPIRRRGKWNSASCPRCGRWLRTPEARQCFHCGADWH